MVLVSLFNEARLKVIVFKITGHYKSWPFLFDVNSRINTKVKRSSSCLSNCKGLLGHAIKDTLAYQIAVCMRQDHCVKNICVFTVYFNWQLAPKMCRGQWFFSIPHVRIGCHMFFVQFFCVPPQWVDYSRKKFRCIY